uniref:hypothetical protein n=1 Tax=Acinetobacter baumannii TaxID=470 RepID=UPI001C08E2F4
SQSGDDENVAGGIRNVESPPVAGDEGSGAAFEGEEDADRTFGGSSSDYGDDGLPGDDELSGAKGDEGSGEIPEFLRR